MILAGGLSTRLYPLTLDVPKPLVPVLDRPVVGHVVDYLHSFGVDDLVINVHYFAEAVERYIGDGSRFGVRMHYLREPRLMGSAGAVKQVAHRFDETFVVIGCDDVCNIDLGAAVAFHHRRQAEATIVCTGADDMTQYGVVVTNGDGRVLEFQEKPRRGEEKSDLVNTGVYIFEPALLDRIPSDTFYDFGKQVFPELLAAGGRFFGMRQDAYWCDIGTLPEYRRIHRDALRGRLRLHLGDGSTLREGVLTGSGATVDPSARLAAPVCIGAGCRIEGGAAVESSILWSGVVVGAGATIRDAVLAQDVRVEAGSCIEGGEYPRAATLSTNDSLR